MEPRQIEILCNELGLGDIVVAPAALSGGLLHRMYAVQTTSGKTMLMQTREGKKLQECSRSMWRSLIRS